MSAATSPADAPADDRPPAIELQSPTAPLRPTTPSSSAAEPKQQRAQTVDPLVTEPRVVSASPVPTSSTRTRQPVRLVVDRIGIDVPVRPTGVAADGSMSLPDTVRRAGWYRYSALPGADAGSTVIAAHVDTVREGLGPFAALTDSRRGDQVVLIDRDGERHSYRITSRRHIARSRLPVAELFDVTGPPRLVLITCGGAYDARNGYHDNVVVLAEPQR